MRRRLAYPAFLAALVALQSVFAAPARPSDVPAAAHDPIAVAILVMDPQWPAFEVRHLATAMGIPAFVTHDPQEALHQPFVVMAGEVDSMSPDLVSRLKQFVSGGGTLVVDDPESAGAQDVLGIEDIVASQARHRLHYDVTSGDPGFAHLRAPESQTVVVGNSTKDAAYQTQGLTPAAGSGARVIATFDDGTGAISVRPMGSGRAYGLGLSLFNQVLVTQLDRGYDSQRWYSNHFEPSADTPQLILRDWYLTYVPGAVVLDAAPEGKSGSLIFTHDVDASVSIANMVAYARAEHALGFRATYFIQTKIVSDYADVAFYDAAGKKKTAAIASLGADLASHSVAHGRDYRDYPYGSGKDTPETYRPRVVSGSATETKGLTLRASLLGEMEVSKTLIERAVPGVTVDAWRSPNLFIHPRQFEALTAAGYRYDSSYTAGNIMSAFPYFAMERSASGADEESGIIEIPILVTDNDPEPMMPLMADFKTALDDEAVFHAPCVVLIHPTVIGEKLETERELAAYVASRFWIGDLDTFGDFWRARSRVGIATSTDAGGAETIRVEAPNTVAGLTLDFGLPMALDNATGSAATISSDGLSIVLGTLDAGQTATLRLHRVK